MFSEFDEARLDDPAVLADYDDQLRRLATAGARIRSEALDARTPADLTMTPRGVIVAGAEARLIGAVLEPVCPVPLIAWPLPGLPGWVGAHDLVVVLASEAEGYQSPALMATVAEATRRGAQVMLAAPEDSPIAQMISSQATQVFTRSDDPTAAAVAVLAQLHNAGLGPIVNTENAAEAADMVAEGSTPHRDLSSNPAKDLACALADADPLLWGGSVLAARAGRRLAEAIRAASGRHAVAADAAGSLEVLRHVKPHDPFADPFTDEQQRRTVLVILDDEHSGEAEQQSGRSLRETAQRSGVRICEIGAGQGSEVDRYITLLMQGLYGATYLAIGLDGQEGRLGADG